MKKMLCLIYLIVPYLACAKEFVLKTTPGTDITLMLQEAVNDNQSIVIDGNYKISNTITLTDQVTITGIHNAVLNCSDDAKGTLASLMRFFFLRGANNHISNLTFKGNLFPHLGNYSLSAIYINSERNIIENCTFSFNFPYGKDVYGIWVSGLKANYNTIKNNRCYTVGIQYAESAASYNVCTGNYIYKAGTDGLQGTGNNADRLPCKQNKVSYNIVDQSGYSGIEDQQYIDGTIISNNTVTNSGRAGYHVNSMGISAVGTNTIVTQNQVSGFGIYGIEVAGGAGLKIEDNTVTDNIGKASLVMVNLLTPARPDYIGKTFLLKNKLYGGNMGIDIEGNYNVKIQVEGNFIENFRWRGISLETTSADAAVEIAHNVISLTASNIKSRSAIFSYASKPTFCSIKINDNTIKYSASLKKGLGSENGIVLGHSGTSLNNNSVIATGTDVNTYTTNGITLSGIKLLENKSIGGSNYLPGVKKIIQTQKK